MDEIDLEGTVVLLTGGTSGIGRVATRMLASRGARVAIVGRNREYGERIAREYSAETAGVVDFYRADLAKQSTVRALAIEVSDQYDRLDALVHNAGLTSGRRTETPDGIELTFAVNHLAPYLLTHELIHRLEASAPSRVVLTGSAAHRRASLDFEDLQSEREYDALEAYARSKLANVVFTIELAARLDGAVTANCVHPGFIPSTGLLRDATPWKRVAMRFLAVVPGVGTTSEEGARRLVRLVTAPVYGERSGCYVGSDGIETPSPTATDRTVRERLWNESAALVGVDPDWP